MMKLFAWVVLLAVALASTVTFSSGGAALAAGVAPLKLQTTLTATSPAAPQATGQFLYEGGANPRLQINVQHVSPVQGVEPDPILNVVIDGAPLSQQIIMVRGIGQLKVQGAGLPAVQHHNVVQLVMANTSGTLQAGTVVLAATLP